MDNLNTADLRRASFIVPQGGANLEVMDPETGEVIAAIGFSGGIHRLNLVAQYFPEGSEFRPVGGVITLRHAERGSVLRDVTRNESGANPDFQPKRLSDTEAMLFGMVRKLQEKVAGADKRNKTASKLAEKAAEKAADETAEAVLVEEPDETPPVAAE